MKQALKWAAVCLAVGVVALAAWILVEFNGDPISSWLSRRTVEKYLAETYPDHVFDVQGVSYNFKFDEYNVRVSEGGEETFLISATPRGVNYDEYRYTAARDHTLSERFSTQFATAIEKLLAPEVPELDSVGIDFYVARDVYPPDKQFETGMEADVDVSMGLIGEMISPERFAELCVLARDRVLAAGYQPRSFYFLYNEPGLPETGKEGPLVYTLGIDSEHYQATAGQLLAEVGQGYNVD